MCSMWHATRKPDSTACRGTLCIGTLLTKSQIYNATIALFIKLQIFTDGVTYEKSQILR